MSSDLFFLRQLFSDSGSGWVSGALLVSLFVILAFRPERIRHHGLFRLACVLLALSIAMPPLVTFVATFGLNVFGPPSQPTGRFSGTPWMLQLAHACGPLFVGGGVFCGLWSLLPADRYTGPMQPTRHPLE